MFTVLLPQSVGYVVLSFAVVLSFYKKRICGWFESGCRLRYFNIQKTLHFFVIACCVCLWVFFIERLCGLFVVVFLWLILRLIDEIVFRVCLLCFVLSVLLIEWFWIVFSDCLIWLIVPVGCFLLNGCDFVERRKIMVGGALQCCRC